MPIELPLRKMPVQPVPHVADRAPVNPLKVTVLLVIVELKLTPVWFVKVIALGVPPPPVVTDQADDMVAPMATVAVTVFPHVAEETVLIANVSP